MYGWERLTSVCGLGCKVFWHPWASSEKSPYDPVLKLDDDVEKFDAEPVTSEPPKPDWGDLTPRAPIVKNKANSMSNIHRSGASYEKLPGTGNSVPKLNNKRLSKPELTGSKTSLSGSRSSLTGSTASNDVLEVTEMVTTV